MTTDKSVHSAALPRPRSLPTPSRLVPGRFIVHIQHIGSFAPRAFGSLAILSLSAALMATQAWGMPSDRLMPAATQGFASVASVEQLVNNWHQTQLGHLVQDDTMRPFIDDIRDQFNNKISGVKHKLGFTYADLQEIAAGELGVGLVEMKSARAALALTVDTTGRQRQLENLLAKVDRELAKLNATKSTADRDGTTFVTFDIPPQREGDIARQTVYFVKDNILVATDSASLANEIFRRFGLSSGGLAEVAGYQETMQRCEKEAGDMTPDLRWYVNPFGYARAVRTLEP